MRGGGSGAAGRGDAAVRADLCEGVVDMQGLEQGDAAVDADVVGAEVEGGDEAAAAQDARHRARAVVPQRVARQVDDPEEGLLRPPPPPRALGSRLGTQRDWRILPSEVAFKVLERHVGTALITFSSRAATAAPAAGPSPVSGSANLN